LCLRVSRSSKTDHRLPMCEPKAVPILLMIRRGYKSCSKLLRKHIFFITLIFLVD
jgi:hypothetical protein